MCPFGSVRSRFCCDLMSLTPVTTKKGQVGCKREEWVVENKGEEGWLKTRGGGGWFENKGRRRVGRKQREEEGG